MVSNQWTLWAVTEGCDPRSEHAIEASLAALLGTAGTLDLFLAETRTEPGGVMGNEAKDDLYEMLPA